MLLCTGLIENVQAQELVRMVAELEPSVFEIHSYGENGLPLASGTGFVIAPEGVAVTNWHVIEDCAFAVGLFEDGTVAEVVEVQKASETIDLAQIKLNLPDGYRPKPLPLQTELPAKGSELFIIGYPEGYSNFVSKGLVSAYDDSEGHQMIQSEASISGGSSGSPAFNMAGKVVGVATASDESGQNLNFITPVSYLEDLGMDAPNTSLTGQLGKHFVFHRRSVDDPNLMLHSIACFQEKTVVHMSYSNTSLLFRDEAFIYSNVRDEEQRFKFTNLETGEQIAVLSTNIGETPQEPTYLDLGETYQMELVFPPLAIGTAYNLTEGMAGGSWSFKNVTLENAGLTVSTAKDLEELEMMALMMFSKEELEYFGLSAFEYMSDMLEKRSLTAFENNLAGVISALFENDGMAKDYFHVAANKSPLYDEPWVNLYMMTSDEEPETELTFLDHALRASPDSPDLHAYRGETNYRLNQFEESEADYLYYISSDRTPNADIHEMCAYAQWYQNKTQEGCFNYYRAMELYLEDESPDYSYIYDMMDLMKDECGRRMARLVRKALL